MVEICKSKLRCLMDVAHHRLGFTCILRSTCCRLHAQGTKTSFLQVHCIGVMDVCASICGCVCLRACGHAGLSVLICMSMCECLCVLFMYVCLYVCLYVCMYACICMRSVPGSEYLYMYTWKSIQVYVEYNIPTQYNVWALFLQKDMIGWAHVLFAQTCACCQAGYI